MRLKGGYTPREAAIDLACGWLKCAYEGKTGDINNYAGSPAQTKAMRDAVATLHNKLLQKSGLDMLGKHLIGGKK